MLIIKMNQEEITKEDLNSQFNSVLKTMLKDTDDFEKLNKKKSKYSQKKDKQGKSLLNDKKKVKFKEIIEDVVQIESFKAYNQKMCFDDYQDTVIAIRKSCCEDGRCILF
jgi:hypothetical protein